MEKELFLEFCRKVEVENTFDKEMWQKLYSELKKKRGTLPENESAKKALELGETVKELTAAMSYYAATVDDPDVQGDVLESIADLSNVLRQ